MQWHMLLASTMSTAATHAHVYGQLEQVPVCSQRLRHVPMVLQMSPSLQATPVGRLIPSPRPQLSPSSPD